MDDAIEKKSLLEQIIDPFIAEASNSSSLAAKRKHCMAALE
jgi:hypothetical protein